MIAAVLLIPADGDPLGLLAEGPCGARPPLVSIRTCDMRGCPRVYVPMDTDTDQCPECGRRRRWLEGSALGLAWDGEVVAEGCDRAQEAAIGPTTVDGGERRWVHAHWFRACVRSLLNPDQLLLREYATRLRDDPRWTIVTLDSEGREATNPPRETT